MTIRLTPQHHSIVKWKGLIAFGHADFGEDRILADANTPMRTIYSAPPTCNPELLPARNAKSAALTDDEFCLVCH